MLQKNESDAKKRYKINLRKICSETVLTSIGAGFSVSTITLFWNSIGMDQTAIGFVQMVFTIVICCLDIPMGYIADRFNRKLLNVIGDIGCAIAFVVYAFAQNMYMAMLSECLWGGLWQQQMALTKALSSTIVTKLILQENCSKRQMSKFIQQDTFFVA